MEKKGWMKKWWQAQKMWVQGRQEEMQQTTRNQRHCW
jgi:hypothetical protein